MDRDKHIKILEIARQRLIDCPQYVGICNRINDVWLHSNFPYADCEWVLNWFRGQNPASWNKYSEFTKHPTFGDNKGWWWQCNQEGKEQRILFLDTLINNLKNNLHNTF